MQVTRVDGVQLLAYWPELERVVCVCVRLRCRRASALACGLLEQMLRSLSLIYPTEYRSTARGFHSQLPIRVKGSRFPRRFLWAEELQARPSDPGSVIWSPQTSL